jgi:hypothetical protein
LSLKKDLTKCAELRDIAQDFMVFGVPCGMRYTATQAAVNSLVR